MSFNTTLISDNLFSAFSYIQIYPEYILKAVQILIALLLVFYSGFKFLFHSVISVKHIMRELTIVLFWGIILFTSSLYLYINGNHHIIKDIILPLLFELRKYV